MVSENKNSFRYLKITCLIVLFGFAVAHLGGSLSGQTKDGLSIKSESFRLNEEELLSLSPALFVEGDEELLEQAKLDILADDSQVQEKQYNSQGSLTSIKGLKAGEYEGVVTVEKREVTFRIICR
ncbi:hypothetical protein M2146_002668 [Lachnospiraceae bacterium PF1-22]|uniref:hypothetical protein n=1 Tax=Ohessyouella blattaphilus TaxID=2949333 RepID=UPI003E1CFAD4